MTAGTEARTSKRRFARCCTLCLIAPAALFAITYAVYRIGNRTPEITIPGHIMPADNARGYFLRAAALSESMKHKSKYDMTGTPAQNDTLANFRGCAIDAEPALRIMREGLRHPCMAPAVRSVRDDGSEGSSSFRELERANAGAAHYYAVTGDPDRAVRMRLDGMEMGVMLVHGGNFEGLLVANGCESIGESRIEPLLPRLSSSGLKLAAERLDEIKAKRVPYGDVVLEEGYSMAANFLELLKDPRSYSELTVGGLLRSGASGYRLRDVLPVIRFTMANKQAIARNNLDWCAAMASEAKSLYTGPSRVPPPDNLLAQSISKSFNLARQKSVTMEAASAVLRVEVALYRYRKDHGQYPTSLAELAPAYLKAVPADPCGGKPLHYTVKNGGKSFLLYSIGADLKDNGGTAGRWPGDVNTDIVAGKIYREKPILANGHQ